MNSPKMPGFTAGTSCYNAVGRYQSTRHAINRATGIGAIYPEMMNQGGEVISVKGCSAGFLQLGEGSSMTCIPDPTLTGGGGDPGGGGPGAGGYGGGGSGSGSSKYNPTQGGKCHAESSSGSKVNVGSYNDTKQGWECCSAKLSDGSQLCINCQDDPKRCQDGHTPFG